MIKAKKDSGVIKVPMLSPHLELFTFADEELGISPEMIKKQSIGIDKLNFTFIVNDQGNGHFLPGRKTRDILRLVDGKKSRYDIVEALKDTYPESDINVTFANLAYNFVIVSAEHSLKPEFVALLSQIAISPSYYQELTETMLVHCINLSQDKNSLNELKKALGEIYITTTEDKKESSLVLVLTDDYLQADLMAFNKQCLKDGTRWMPIKLKGTEMAYGPIFIPKNDSVCLHCITNNMRNNREMRGFLEYNKPGALVSKVGNNFSPLSYAHIFHVLFSIIKTLVLEKQLAAENGDNVWLAQEKSLNDYLFSYDIFASRYQHHYVVKRPQCLSCGDPELNDKSRSPKAVDLFKQDPSSVFTSGGMKATTSEQTFKKYEHLVSPLTGIITAIERSSPSDDDWMHVYWSGSNLAIANRNFMSLNTSLRSKSAGKGRSDAQARVSAMCEALERYSGVFNGDEIRKIAKFSDFPKGDALHPNDIMLFSKTQYKNRDEIAKKNYRFYRLPAEDFDENAEVEWSPVWSITQKKHIWMMCYQLYFSYDPSCLNPEDARLNHNFANPDSNGAASGNTPAEAFTQGFLELVERDAYAIWWYNRISYPEVDLSSFNDPYLDMAIKRYKEKYHRKLWVLDITSDLGIPVLVAISYRFDKKKQDICISAGAHFNPHIAALRAVCELNQYISAVLKSTDETNSYTYFDPECNDWWQNATLDGNPYLLPDKNSKIKTKSDYDFVERNLNEEVQACIEAVHKQGLEVLVLDQTRPDIGLPVMKVMVPGLRHFWARFAPGRLYDAPIRMGKLKKPSKEDDLNPVPVFI